MNHQQVQDVQKLVAIYVASVPDVLLRCTPTKVDTVISNQFPSTPPAVYLSVNAGVFHIPVMLALLLQRYLVHIGLLQRRLHCAQLTVIWRIRQTMSMGYSNSSCCVMDSFSIQATKGNAFEGCKAL